MSSMRVCRAAALFGLVATFLWAASADAVCVTTPQALDDALYNWSNGSADADIRIVQGDYNMSTATSGGNELYQGSNGNKLTLRGGYAPGTSCATANRVLDATNTRVFSNDSFGSVFDIQATNSVLIEGVTFESFRDALSVALQGDATQQVHLRYLIVHNFGGPSTNSGLQVRASGGAVARVDDNLVYQVSVSGGTGRFALSVSVDDGGSGYVYNNTVAENYADGLDVGGAFGTMLVTNNILYGNIGTDLTGSSLSFPVISHSIYVKSAGILAPDGTNTSSDPLFVNANTFDLHPGPGSPAINSGAASIPGSYPALDLDGKDRTVGSAIDRGPYEATLDDLNNFVVSTGTDNGNNSAPTIGSLRAAIKNANANPGASKISFNLSGCPALLQVGVALPAIATDVTIDGYTQPGSQHNTDPLAFNATMCVYMTTSTSVADGLRVTGSGRVTVRGLAFSGFSESAIRVDGGSGTLINGNQFGEIPLVAANYEAIYVTGSATNVHIGGYDDPSLYNLIGNSSSNGIHLDNASGGSVIANNIIGLQKDGLSAAANLSGILVLNSPHNYIQYNVIASNNQGGILIVGPSATFNTMQYNQIGTTATGGDSGNGVAGIQVALGAANNTIGALQSGTTGGNTIQNTTGPGVFISSGGTGNSVLANAIALNTGLAIDLGTLGPTANDALDADSGPNNTQNFPVVLSAARSAAGEYVEVSLDTFANDAFRLDFYLSSSCPGAGAPARGEAAIHIGKGSVLADASGHAHASIKLPAINLLLSLGQITATATATNGDTSEISSCRTEIADAIFKSGFQ